MARQPHRLLLPTGRLDADGEAVWSSRQQEVATLGRLQERALPGAEMKGRFELGSLARPLSAKKEQSRVGRDDGSCVGAQQVAWILSCEHQSPVVFANPPR